MPPWARKALDLLEQAYAEKSSYLLALGTDFVFESIWNEPRPLEIQRKRGISGQSGTSETESA